MRLKNYRSATVLALLAACSFPRPADVASGSDGGDDVPTGCTRDEDCGRSTPFCVDTVCVACKASDTCPMAEPVCDQTSHECRNCIKDSECDSGACDIAAGTCVEPSKILYVSPAGTQSDPCARLLPCSLDKAASTSGPDHPYIVMLPGTHVVGGDFFNKKVTLCGNDATLDDRLGQISVRGGASLTIRDLNIFPSSETTLGFGGTTGIYAFDSELTLINVHADQTNLLGGTVVSSYYKTTIQRSTFIKCNVQTIGQTSIDQSRFLSAPIGITHSGDYTISVTNSIFTREAGENSFYMADDALSSPTRTAYIIGNTFAGGGLSCGGGQPTTHAKWFDSNIFLNTGGLQPISGCGYEFNLIQPMTTVNGANNIAGDPSFVDASTGDFHLRAGSPAIDHANPTPQQSNTHDYDGKGRGEGTRPEIGAFEYRP